MKKYKIALIPTLSLFAPMIVMAATIDTIIGDTTVLLKRAIPILMVLATVVFIWGLIRFVTAAGSDEAKSQAKNLMIWGVLGLFVMVAMWGLVQVIGTTFSVGTEGIPTGPTGPTGP